MKRKLIKKNKKKYGYIGRVWLYNFRYHPNPPNNVIEYCDFALLDADLKHFVLSQLHFYPRYGGRKIHSTIIASNTYRHTNGYVKDFEDKLEVYLYEEKNSTTE